MSLKLNDFKVGQQWMRNDGQIVIITKVDGSRCFPIVAVSLTGERRAFTDEGHLWTAGPSTNDLHYLIDCEEGEGL